MENSEPSITKEAKLRSWMREQSKVLVAFSGGVDSSYLAFIAHQELGENAFCVTGISPSVSSHQIELAKSFAFRHRIEHRLVSTDEMEVEGYVNNAGDRCFFCKTELYTRLSMILDSEPIGTVIVDGTNSDDLNDFRPGMKAASDLGVISPLAEFGLTKSEIRANSKELRLETHDLPAAPCLSSRIAVGVKVSSDVLRKIEYGEAMLRANGFKEFRLRVHGDIARIEIAESEMKGRDFLRIIKEVSHKIKETGFEFVTLDLEGFRSGSLNPPEAPLVEITRAV